MLLATAHVGDTEESARFSWDYYLEQTGAHKYLVYATTYYTATRAREKTFPDYESANEYYTQEIGYYNH